MPITRDDISSFSPELVLHCRMCLDERPADVSPKDFARLSFGVYHKDGEAGAYFQLWCDRHDCNVTTINIETNQWSHADDIPLRVSGIDDEDSNRKDNPHGLSS
jgi:hypothetical protein